MLGHQFVQLFGKDGGMALLENFEVSKAHAGLSWLSLSLHVDEDGDSQLLLQCHACLPPTKIPMVVTGSVCNRKPPLNAFFSNLP